MTQTGPVWRVQFYSFQSLSRVWFFATPWTAAHQASLSITNSQSFLKLKMATHSSVLAWRIPGMREPGGLLSLGSHRVGQDWSDLAAAAAVIFHCAYASQLPYPFICQWASMLLPCPSCWKQCYSEHWGTRFFFTSGLLSVYAQQWVCWVIWQFYFQFSKESPHCSP